MKKIVLLIFVVMAATLLILAGCSSGYNKAPPAPSGGGCGVSSYGPANSVSGGVAAAFTTVVKGISGAF